MGNKEKNLVKKALEYFNQFSETRGKLFVFHNYKYICETIENTRLIAKSEGLSKDDYEIGLVARILGDIGLLNTSDKEMDNTSLVNAFLEDNYIGENISKEIWNYIEFFRTSREPKNIIEKVLNDGKYSYLGFIDSLERMELLRKEERDLHHNDYTEHEWLLYCKEYFIRHGFETHYANSNYGSTRNRNYVEIEKRLDKIKPDVIKVHKDLIKDKETETLSSREGDDLFKIAFRNYINLVDIADKKAALLIQVNTILASVVGAFGIKRLDTTPFYALPTAAILIGSAITIFFAILASKPLSRNFIKANETGKEVFFFGSFDRIDPGFKHVTWQKYKTDMTQFFNGNKVFVFDEMIKESYQVRHVLSKKFIYLSYAYKVFFGALLIGILGYLAVLIYEYNLYQPAIK